MKSRGHQHGLHASGSTAYTCINMLGRSLAAAEAKAVRPGAGRRPPQGIGSVGSCHFGKRCCLAAGTTTDHSQKQFSYGILAPDPVLNKLCIAVLVLSGTSTRSANTAPLPHVACRAGESCLLAATCGGAPDEDDPARLGPRRRQPRDGDQALPCSQRATPSGRVAAVRTSRALGADRKLYYACINIPHTAITTVSDQASSGR